MDNQSAAPTLPLKVYSLKLNHIHIEHLKNNKQGEKPSSYLRSLIEADMLKRGSECHAKAI